MGKNFNTNLATLLIVTFLMAIQLTFNNCAPFQTNANQFQTEIFSETATPNQEQNAGSSPAMTSPIQNEAPLINADSIIYNSINFKESDEFIPNPEIGFYDRIDLTEITEANLIQLRDKGNNIYPYPIRLVYTQVNISQFRNTDLTSDFLKNLEAKLNLVRKTSMKLIIRFVYDDSEKGLDASATQIQKHLEQLDPFLKKYQDTIAYFQAGFIGAWGEWHSSQSGNSFGYNATAGITEALADSRRLAIKNSLALHVPSQIKINFRYPNDLIKWSSNLPSNSNFGFHNDCWMAGPDDMGTFNSTSEREFAKQLTLNNPFGGETCSDGTTVLRNSCSESIAEAQSYHLTYLNVGYSLDFIDRWKKDGCFLNIAKSMGYKFSFINLKIPNKVKTSDKIRIELKIKNKGWSKIFKPRNIYINLKNTDTQKVVNIKLGSLNLINPQDTLLVSQEIDLKNQSELINGKYQLSLSMPDQSLLDINEIALANNSYNAVRPANLDDQNQAWDSKNSIFNTGAVIEVVD